MWATSCARPGTQPECRSPRLHEPAAFLKQAGARWSRRARKKLLGIADGWMPQAVDLGLWRELRVITTTRDGITVNCYLVWDEVSREGAVFHSGWEASPILEWITENGVNLRH